MCTHRDKVEAMKPVEFQFPSNGKAHVHGIIGGHKDDEVETVSIPFKRESTCAHGSVLSDISAVAKSFNSLQTGKHMCTVLYPHSGIGYPVAFPFPSNGKAHVHYSTQTRSWKDFSKFQFPSNGKAHVHENFKEQTLEKNSFNSLQTGKHMCTRRILPA